MNNAVLTHPYTRVYVCVYPPSPFFLCLVWYTPNSHGNHVDCIPCGDVWRSSALCYIHHTIISMNKYGIKKQQMLLLEEKKIGYALLDPIAWRSIAM